DFGPLGELLVPAEDYIPLGLGLHVDIGEIPVSGDDRDEERPAADPDEVKDPGGGSIDALGGDIASYASLFSPPQALLDPALQGLCREVLTGSALAVCLVPGGLVGLAAFLGSQRLDGIVRALVGKELIGICLLIVLVLTGIGGLVLNRPKP